MIDEGYVKYKCNHIHSLPIDREQFVEIDRWRDRLYQLGLIGQYNNGISFGNISIRDTQSDRFIISGTATGGIPHLNEQHYTKVIDFNWEQNYLTCCGPIPASSESLTHAAIYQTNCQVNAIIHIHHRLLWQKLMYQVPTTADNCAYGTPEMAKEIIRLSQNNSFQQVQIIVMSGHEEGIITFGKNLQEAGNLLLEFYNKL